MLTVLLRADVILCKRLQWKTEKRITFYVLNLDKIQHHKIYRQSLKNCPKKGIPFSQRDFVSIFLVIDSIGKYFAFLNSWIDSQKCDMYICKMHWDIRIDYVFDFQKWFILFKSEVMVFYEIEQASYLIITYLRRFKIKGSIYFWSIFYEIATFDYIFFTNWTNPIYSDSNKHFVGNFLWMQLLEIKQFDYDTELNNFYSCLFPFVIFNDLSVKTTVYFDFSTCRRIFSGIRKNISFFIRKSVLFHFRRFLFEK